MTLVPNWPDLDSLVQPLSATERRVAAAYERLTEGTALPISVYVRPVLADGSHQPSLVVAHPAAGLLIMEIVREDVDTAHALPDGLRRVNLARERLHRLSWFAVEDGLPDLPASQAVRLNSALKRTVIRAVALCGWSPAAVASVRRILPESVLVIDDDTLERGELPLPEALQHDDPDLLSSAWPVYFRRATAWLVPPYHRWEEGHRFTLSPDQKRHVSPRQAGRYRIQGPAGSGKSLVLCYRAAALAAKGRRVLITFFNIALRCYLRDVLRTTPYSFDWGNVTLVHFDRLFWDLRRQADCEPLPKERSPSDLSAEERHDLVSELLDRRFDARGSFDGIFVDEGQDFTRDWFAVLEALAAKNAEILLVRDKDQNIFSREQRWLETPMTGFRTWGQLRTTFRTSPALTTRLSAFAEAEFGAPAFQVASEQKEFEGLTTCIWRNVEPEELQGQAVQAVRDLAESWGATHPSDIAVITFSNDHAREAILALRSAGFSPVHFFNHKWRPDRDRKLHFYKSSGSLKVATIQNYRGFEISRAVVLVPKYAGPKRVAARQIYSAASRAIHGVIVLNADTRFLRYARQWDS